VSNKKILFITGTRAEFGKLKPLINILKEHNKFDYQLFVTGMHLLELYGNTYREIERSGFENLHMFSNQNIGEPMEIVLANTIAGLSRHVNDYCPDLIVIHGDRAEAMAGAVVGSFNNILVAHIEGGERSGTIDEMIRHSITKLSHIHMVSNDEAKARIIQMGEDEKSVYVTGSPDIDVMKSPKLPDIETVKKYYEIKFDKYHIAIFHPVTTEAENTRQQADALVDAMIESGENFIVVYPNNDNGNKDILNAYKKLEGNSHFRIFPSIRFEYFLTMIKNAVSMVGNSSAGVREAPFYGVPTINIGTRQNMRCNSESIINTDYDKNDIMAKIQMVSTETKIYPESQQFGNGKSAELFIETLLNDAIWKTPKQKIFVDYQEKNNG